MHNLGRQDGRKVSERAGSICKLGRMHSPHSQSLTERLEKLLGQPGHCFSLLSSHSRHYSIAQHSRLAALSTVADPTELSVSGHSFAI